MSESTAKVQAQTCRLDEASERLPYECSPAAKFDAMPIIAKLCHPTRGLGWTMERASGAVEKYRRWLWLNAEYPGENLPPSTEIDRVWHVHVLDTYKYAEDCKDVLGYFLHHNPYAGWENEDAKNEHDANWQRTRGLFQQHFGDSVAAAGICNAGGCDTGGCDKDGITRHGNRIWRPTADYVQRITN